MTDNRSIAVTGPNGSGKSTLVKIIAGVLSPSSGSVQLELGTTSIPRQQFFERLGLVSPYLQLYDEFTAWENLDFVRKIRGLNAGDDVLNEQLTMVKLFERRHDIVRTFSSGMKQRLKYAFALLHRPAVLLLDEPTTNLDEEGVATVNAIIEQQRSRGIVIVATNDPAEARQCDEILDLREYQKRKDSSL